MGFFINGMIAEQVAITATSGGTTTLANNSKQIQQFTGSSGQTVLLPPTTNMSAGQWFEIYNSSSGSLTMQYQDASSFAPANSVSPNTTLVVKLVSAGTTNGTWVVQATSANASSGSKNYLSEITTTNGANNGNGNFELGSTTGWSVANSAISGTTPATTSVPGQAYVSGQYIFTVSSANATAGATYTNNGQTFTVVATISAGTILVTTGTGAPSNSGTLTKATGTGDSTITFSAYEHTSSSSQVISIVSSGQLAGTYSLSMVASSGTLAGDMIISNETFIDTEDQAKMLTFKLYYSLIAGTANFSGTSSNSFAIWIYDVTNGAWIQPAGVYGMVQDSGVGYTTGTFQTPVNMTAFQIAIFNSNHTSVATTLYLDDISVGPQTAPMGPAMSDWVAYTPALVGFGTPSAVSFYSRRVGDTLQVQGVFTSGTSTATLAQLGLGYNGAASNVTIDSTKTSSNSNVGTGILNLSNGFTYPILATGGNNYFLIGHSDGSHAGLTPANGNDLLSSGQSLSFFAIVPIAGWSSNSVQSADTDTRVVAASYTSNNSPSIGTGFGAVAFNVQSFDTHAAYSGSTYTVPVTGKYSVSCLLTLSSGTSATLEIQLWKNGSFFAELGETGVNTALANLRAGGTTTVQCNAGDTLQIQAAAGTSDTLLGTSGYSHIDINRLSGPAVVTATESVNARYNTSSSTIGTSASLITFTSKNYDTHNAYSTSTGLYTAPVSGKYAVKSFIESNGPTLTTTDYLLLYVFINGSQYGQLGTILGNGATNFYGISGSDTVQVNAGDTIAIYAQSPGVSTSATGSSCSFAVERIGN